MSEVIVLGELCADIVVEIAHDIEFGQTETLVPATRVTMGGSSSITACGLARLGLATELVSVCGDDLLGGFLRDELTARSVGTTWVRADTTMPTGSSTILTKEDGDRAILTALGSIGQVGIDDVPTPLPPVTRHVHVGSYFLQYALHGHLGSWFTRCRADGLTTSLDPNFDPQGSWDREIQSVLPHTDIFFCNEEEACGITGVQDVDEATRRLLSLLPSSGELVLKRGVAGAEVHQRAVGRVAREPAPDDSRPVMDAVGAGDNLAAGYLAARLRDLTIPAALRVGVASGTASTRAPGGVLGQLVWDPAWGS